MLGPGDAVGGTRSGRAIRRITLRLTLGRDCAAAMNNSAQSTSTKPATAAGNQQIAMFIAARGLDHLRVGFVAGGLEPLAYSDERIPVERQLAR